MKRKEFLTLSAAGLAGLGLPFPKPASAALRAISGAGAAGDDEAFWKIIRDQFILDPDWTFLNFGGLGSCPLPVLQSLAEWSRTEERAPSAGHDAKEWDKVKDKLAALLGRSCRRGDLALINCATEGVNMIINGLPLKAGDEVITSTHEHVAVNTGLLNRMQRDGIALRLFEPDIRSGRGNVDRIAALVTGRTRLIIVSHVTCTTGQLLPAADIAALACAKGIWFALDGAQAPVCVPFDIAETGADFYTCSTHKWAMGPKRTGFLYVRPGMLDVLRPLAVGAGSSKSYDMAKKELVLEPSVQRFEYGTQNDALFYALGTALDMIATIGPDRIWAHNHAQAERFCAGLREIRGVEIVSPEEETYRTAMIGFRMPGLETSKIMEHLAKDRIRVRPVSEGGLNSIRVSFHVCNMDGDVTKILDSLKKLAGVS
jgi:selenocysteine lyase/cysteine desulfurase